MQSVGRAAQPCRPWRRGGVPSDRGGGPSDRGGGPSDRGGGPSDRGCGPSDRGGGPSGPNAPTATAEAKPTPGGFRREDKNMNTVAASSPRRLTKDPPNRTTTTTTTRAGGVQPRTHRQQAPNPALSRLGLHQKTPASSSAAAAPSPANRGSKTKPRIIPRGGTGGGTTTVSKVAASGASKASRRPAAAPQAPLLPLPSISAAAPSSGPLLALDANCNEPSLPCLCCDGRSPQDSNSMFNHNHNNNNAVSIRRQLRLQLPPGTPPPARLPPQRGGGGDAKVNKGQQSPASSQEPSDPSGGQLTRQGEGEEAELNHDIDNRNVRGAKEEDEEPYEDEEEESSSSAEISDSVEDLVDDDDDDDDDDTLVPSCCDCPASLLDFSLTSSCTSSTSSSSSTSISSCSDLESDCADLSSSCHDLLEELNTSSAARPPLAVQDQSPTSPLSPILPLKAVRTLLPPPPATTTSASTSPMMLPPCSPDEGYPSAPGTPTSTTSSSDYLGVKGHETGHMGSEVTRLGLLDFLESLGEFGKMERFSQVVQVARWDLEQQWEVLRDRLDHLDRMEKVNRQVRLVHAARLHEKGLEGELDLLDEMGNNNMSCDLVPWKLYRSGGRGADSQEFSDDGGVDLTAPSDCDDEPPTPDSLAPSPVGHAPRPPNHRHTAAMAPPKPPARHASVSSDLSDYFLSRETTPTSSIIAIPSVSPTASSAFSPRSPTASPTFSTFFRRCEKPPPAPLSSLPPLPLLSQPPPPPPPSSSVPYFALYDDEVAAPPCLAPPRPVPPPRRRHLARKEAKRLAALQAAVRQQEEGSVSSPLSLPPPSGRPPPLPPPPVVSVVSTSSPPAVPPPPSFHALDDEIRKLLMLAGLTQAELLRLSPELGGVCPELGGVCTELGGVCPELGGVCTTAGGLEERRVAPSAPPEDIHLTEDEEDEEEPYEELERCHTDEEVAVDGWRCSGGTTAATGGQEEEEEERGAGEGEEARKKTKKREEEETGASSTTTTSFGELAKRRKRYSGRFPFSDLYSSTTPGGATSPPPPPPPRPLPPIPRSISSAGGGAPPRPTKSCSVSANAARPERFDWLIAFTPEDAGGGGTLMPPPPRRPAPSPPPGAAARRPAPSIPPVAATRRTSDAVALPPKLPQRPAPSPPVPPTQTKARTTSSSSSSSSPPLPPPSSSSSSSSSLASTGSRVTSFKELRLRSRNSGGCTSANSLATVISSDPDPDPSIMTPDPDILYNLRWRRETQGGDGSQWEYTSQAHEVFMQPPPALASLDALREMLRRDEEKKQAGVHSGGTLLRSNTEPCKEVRGTPRRGGGGGTPRNDTAVGPAQQGGVEEEKQATKWRKEEEEEVEVRGRADGGRTLESRSTAVRSVSFAGSTQRGGTSSWMGDEDVHIPARGPMSSLCPLQDKKALVSAVSIAVEAILAQFTSSRTVVQKALSGDSSVNPSVGRVVVQCLCPALWGLLSDGLKPHQSDLISGRRPNSAWGLVQASTKPGPSTQALYSLQVRVGSLPQLRQSKHRFNAFLLGLLNTKSLDLWLCNLQSCSDVLESFYQPWSFLRLPACRTLFEEVLLLLQPLSLLTFNLDLLFQHHHLLLLASQPSSSSTGGKEEIPAPQRGGSPPTAAAPTTASRGAAAFIVRPMANKGSLSKTRGRGGPGYLESLSELDFGSAETNKEAVAVSSASSSPPQADDPTEEEAPGGKLNPVKPRPVVSLGQTSPQLMWVQEKLFRDIAPPVVEEVSLTQQAEQVLQQGWGAVVRWGGRLGHNLTDGLGLYGARRAGEEEEEEEDGGQPRSDFPRVDCGGDDGGSGEMAVVPWGLGRFFGASRNPSGGSPLSVHTHTARRPSEWIAPGVTALTRMVSSTSTPILRKALEPLGESYYADREPESLEMTDKPRALRSVRTLCDHSGAGGEELSFRKGEELELLGGVDHDWIRCRRADKEGLVPIGYASLIM